MGNNAKRRRPDLAEQGVEAGRADGEWLDGRGPAGRTVRTDAAKGHCLHLAETGAWKTHTDWHRRHAGDGKRASYHDSVMWRGFIWDGENILFQTDGPENPGRTTNRHYSYNPQGYGELIPALRPAGKSQSGVFHHGACPERSRGDGFGSTDQITNAAGKVRNHYLYQAFGQVTALEADEPNRFTWLGRIGYYEQPDTGDYWVRARVYSPTNGRWVSRDPEATLGARLLYVPGRCARPSPASTLGDPGGRGAAVHIYDYATNGPLGFFDPSGLQSSGMSSGMTNAQMIMHFCGFICQQLITGPTLEKVCDRLKLPGWWHHIWDNPLHRKCIRMARMGCHAACAPILNIRSSKGCIGGEMRCSRIWGTGNKRCRDCCERHCRSGGSLAQENCKTYICGD